MTNHKELVNKMKKKYHEGDIITLKIRDFKGIIIQKIKVKIIKFYTNHVLTERNGIMECYSYYDLLSMTQEADISKSIIKHGRGTKYADNKWTQ